MLSGLLCFKRKYKYKGLITTKPPSTAPSTPTLSASSTTPMAAPSRASILVSNAKYKLTIKEGNLSDATKVQV